MHNHTGLAPEDTIEHALDLLDQALTILDGEDLMIAAAKVDDARNALRKDDQRRALAFQDCASVASVR